MLDSLFGYLFLYIQAWVQGWHVITAELTGRLCQAVHGRPLTRPDHSHPSPFRQLCLVVQSLLALQWPFGSVSVQRRVEAVLGRLLGRMKPWPAWMGLSR